MSKRFLFGVHLTVCDSVAAASHTFLSQWQLKNYTFLFVLESFIKMSASTSESLSVPVIVCRVSAESALALALQYKTNDFSKCTLFPCSNSLPEPRLPSSVLRPGHSSLLFSHANTVPKRCSFLFINLVICYINV